MASTKTDKLEKPARSAKPAAKTAKPAAKSGKDKAAVKAKPAKAAPKAAPKAAVASSKAAAPSNKDRTTKILRKPAPQVELDLPAAIVEPIAADGFATPPELEPAIASIDSSDDDEDALHDRIEAERAEMAENAAAETSIPLSPEEQELSTIYGDEMAAAPAGAAHAEFADHRTSDEDRPMLPEINGRAERQKRWEERRDARRSRRDQERLRRAATRTGNDAAAPRPDRPHAPGPERVNGRDEHRPSPHGGRDVRAEEPRPFQPPRATAPIVVEEASDPDATGVIRVGNSLGDAAWQVFASIRGAQPMPVRQLAGMMRKRGLIDADPEVVWPHLKAALLGDERSYKSLGLRPRIVYRGRDLFGPGPVAQSVTATAETDLARALSSMAVATHRALKDRIATATQAGFERLVHAYMVAAGFRDIEWIKRVEGISYATALPPEGKSTVLISARSGDQPVDRRGIGELRVGVEAKQLLAGYLFAARELSPEAERELERNGRSITVMAGDSFVSALLSLGVGVVTAAAPLRYVDDQLLGELLAG